MSWFFTTGGTLHHNSPSYVERASDQQLNARLSEGEFCYVLTARQMGKSSSMVRAAMKLKEQAMDALILDLTAIGQNLNAEQWYDGLLAKIGQSLQMEDALEDYWMDHLRLSPVQRWFQAIREVVLPRISKRLIIFFDELDVVRGLSFC
ncbi:MAG: AAA-like domain-containing protein, partial [Verrucomicrobiota bacterium]|nr:AAA-like domain-containing protein [Verrucomicrobiota bacterium]